MVKHTRGDEVNPSLPHTRSCASTKPSLPGPNSETCIGQSPRSIRNADGIALGLDHTAPLLTSQQGILSKVEEHHDS